MDMRVADQIIASQVRRLGGSPPPSRAEALERVRLDPTTTGICHQCGCSEFNACTVEDLLMGDLGCSWVNRQQTLCSNQDCIEKAAGKL